MADSAYTTQDEALQAVRPGWHIVGSRDDYEDAPFTTPDGKPPLPSDPKTVKKLIGRVLVIQGPNGEPDEMTVGPSDKSVTWDTSIDPATNQPKPLQPGLVIIKGPSKGPAAAGSKPATPAAGLERLDANLNVITDPSKPAVYVRDPNAPAGTQPFKLDDSQTMGDPSTWTPITNPNNPKQVIGLFDPKSGKVGASIAAAAGSKDSDPSKWQPVYRTPGDAKSGIVGQWDPTNNELHAVAQTADGKQIVTTTDAIYVVDKDTGKSVKVTDIAHSSPFQAVIIDGKPYRFDPNEKDPNKAFTPGPINEHPDVKDGQGNPMVWTVQPDGSAKYDYPPGVSPAATVGNSTTVKKFQWFDNQGKLIAERDNPNYIEAQTTQGAQSLTARQIQQWNPKTGQWEWVENKGRVVASDALRAMAQKLTGQVVAGDISEDEATKLITAANAKMANDIAEQNATLSAASTALQTTSQGATTGAGLLNQRVQAGSQMLGQVLGLAGQSHLRGLPEGAGQAIMQDIQGFATNLGGGQDVYDTAVRLIHAADPSAPNELTAKATAFITQVLNKQIQTTGQVPPAVQVTQQLKQNLQNNQGGQNGFTPVPTVRAPTVPVQPPAVAAGQLAPASGSMVSQNYGPATGFTGGIAPSSYGYTPPGYGLGMVPTYGSSAPGTGTVPQPLPQGFVVPITPPAPPQLTVAAPGRLT